MISGNDERGIVAVKRISLHKVPELSNHLIHAVNLLQVQVVLPFVRKFIGFAKA
jgi:hypothetical protein